jgi:hypothetical protein
MGDNVGSFFGDTEDKKVSRSSDSVIALPAAIGIRHDSRSGI